MAKGLYPKYFVLNPNKNTPYGEASRKAIRIYARSIIDTNRELGRDLIAWMNDLEKTPLRDTDL